MNPARKLRPVAPKIQSAAQSKIPINIQRPSASSSESSSESSSGKNIYFWIVGFIFISYLFFEDSDDASNKESIKIAEPEASIAEEYSTVSSNEQEEQLPENSLEAEESVESSPKSDTEKKTE